MLGLSRRSARLFCLASLLASCTLPGPGQEPSGGSSPSGAMGSALTPIDPTADYLALTAGVTSVNSSGVGYLAPLALTGPTAFPVLIDKNSRVYAAASRSGLGKVLAFGRESFVTASVKGSSSTLIIMNAIRWMANKPAPVIGVDPYCPALKTELTAAGFNVKTADMKTLDTVDIFITRSEPFSFASRDAQSVPQFVANGGGLIYGGHGFTFDGPPADLPGNRILAGSGIFLTKNYEVMGANDPVAATPPTMLLNAWVAIGKLTEHATGVNKLTVSEQTLVASVIDKVVDGVPFSVKELWDQAPPAIAAVDPVMSTAKPLVPATNLPGKAAARLQYRLSQDQPADAITAHPSAVDFPGAVPKGIMRETINVTINGTYAGRDSRYSGSGAGAPVWRSTGVYAAPGEIVTVTIPAAVSGRGLSAQIGAHTDQLWGNVSWVRFPGVVRSYPLNSTVTRIASAFGGLVYITVPGGSAFGNVAVTLTNVVRAPTYVHGTTSLAEWMTIRDYPAPWAELVTSKIILTIPSTLAKTITAPDQLMNRWDLILDADADLAGIARNRVRPERFVADNSGNAFLHAGYPIMARLSDAPSLVNTALLGTNSWGLWHELGHNHQWGPWMLQGTLEVSVNWWSVYVAEELFNIPRAKAHGALSPANRAKRAQAYVAGGSKYATWSADAFLPLEMYLQLQEWFGWQPFKDLNADYVMLTPASSPSTDQDKVDQWVLRFSQKVGKNLGPFFKTTWGLPVSQSILDQVALLSPWPISSAPIGLEIEPNDACAQAQPGTAPVYFSPLTLASAADVDWFVLPASAAAVGKVVHVVTTAGEANTNTVVEVFTGSCASLTTLGGPSSDVGIHEDWKSTAIPMAGTIYVKVAYSGAFAGSGYNLTITYE